MSPNMIYTAIILSPRHSNHIASLALSMIAIIQHRTLPKRKYCFHHLKQKSLTINLNLFISFLTYSLKLLIIYHKKALPDQLSLFKMGI